MNLDQNPTPAELAALLRACDDRAGHHIVWVTRDGDVRVDRLARGEKPRAFAARHPDRMQLWLFPFAAGHGFVGPAADDGWVEDVFIGLTEEWKRAKGRPEVAYAADL